MVRGARLFLLIRELWGTGKEYPPKLGLKSTLPGLSITRRQVDIELHIRLIETSL